MNTSTEVGNRVTATSVLWKVRVNKSQIGFQQLNLVFYFIIIKYKVTNRKDVNVKESNWIIKIKSATLVPLCSCKTPIISYVAIIFMAL